MSYLKDKFAGKRVLELGAGTALPGLLAAKLGSQVNLVILTYLIDMAFFSIFIVFSDNI